jgi:hypothetical protein
MCVGEPTGAQPRVLLVTDDDTFSAQVKLRLPGIYVMSLTERSFWLAMRGGLDVTRGIDAVLLDHDITGRLQVRMYETLRPTNALGRVPVIVTRSKLTTATAGFSHELDYSQPERATSEETAPLVIDMLAASPSSRRDASRRDASRRATPATAPVRAHRAAAARGPGLLRRLAPWASRPA